MAFEFLTADVPDAVLLPPERAAIAGAVASRRAEFATVRHCARLALARLGYPPVPVLPGARREPLWPDGVVGSLTHCADFRAAAVARRDDVATLGIDVEVHEPLPLGVAELVTVGHEPGHLARLGRSESAIAWDRVLWSAKESIYKAWFPLAHDWLDFTECELTIGADGTFTGALLVPGPALDGRPITSFSGRWEVRGRHVLTACWKPGVRATTPDC